jgi:hypothetical protein
MSETVNCLSCGRSLRVPEELIGRHVKCPACEHTFVAEVAGAAPPPPEPAARERSERSERYHEEDQPRRRSASSREDEDEDRPRRRGRRHDDEEDEDDRPRRSRRHLEPHRGSLILALGIASLFTMPLILGPLAWVLGNHDIAEIRAGRMDPEGESNTNTGRIIGMVMTILSLIGVLIACLIGGLIIVGAIGAAGAAAR